MRRSDSGQHFFILLDFFLLRRLLYLDQRTVDKWFIECLSLTFFFIFLSFFSLCFVFIEGNYDAQIGERRTNSLLKRGCQIPANMNNEIHLGCDDDHDDDVDDYDDKLQARANMEYKVCLHRDDDDGQKLTWRIYQNPNIIAKMFSPS